MHYFKREIGDYYKKAGRLGMLEHGACTLLTDACYDREQFPTMQEAIDWTWASTDSEIEAVKFVLARLFTLEDGLYINEAIQKELDKYHANAKTNKRIAIAREEKKRENKTKGVTNSTKRAPSVNGSSDNQHESAPNHKPLTTNHKQLTNKDIKDLSPTVSKPAKKKFCAIGYALELQNSLINLAAWQEWVEYRKGKKKAISKPAANKQLKILEAHTLDQQQQIIDQSITNDYQGLFPVKQNNQIGGQSKMDTLLKNNYDSAQDFING
jgi:uncharacterized protein YdaU (DUF1376 family)